jgi:hypothetical protein
MVNGSISFLSDNPAFFTLLIGFIGGYIVGKR